MVMTYAELVRGERTAGRRVAVIGAGGIGVDVSEFLTTEHSPTLDAEAWRAEWGVGDPAETRGGRHPAATAREPAARRAAPAQDDPDRQGPGPDHGLGAPGRAQGQGRRARHRRHGVRPHRRRRPPRHRRDRRARCDRAAHVCRRHRRRVRRPGVGARPGRRARGARDCRPTSSAAPTSRPSSTPSGPSARAPSSPPGSDPEHTGPHVEIPRHADRPTRPSSVSRDLDGCDGVPPVRPAHEVRPGRSGGIDERERLVEPSSAASR